MHKYGAIFITFLFIITLFQFIPGQASAAPLDLKGNYDYSRGWYHRIEKGDSLIKIARKYDRSYKELARINKIDPKKPLYIGNYLYIPPARGSTPVLKSSSQKIIKNENKSRETVRKVPPIPPFYSPPELKDENKDRSSTYVSRYGFIWPLNGRVTREFSKSEATPHKGIDISADEGAIVRAAKEGRVIYSDDGIPSYGKLIIIDHGNEITSIYAHNSALLVRAGQHVRKGHAIARVGSTGRATGSHLHFEIRKKAETVNPRTYLP